MTKVLITGGAGFVGANLAYYLKDIGHDVTVLDNLVRRGSETNLSTFLKRGIKFVHGDIRNTEDFEHLDADVVLECSAQPSAIDGYNNPKFDITNNLYGLINVLEFCRKKKAKLIFWSTNKVYSGFRVNAIPVKEEDSRWVWDTEESLIGFDPNKGISQDFPVDGGDHSIYGMTKVMGDIACQEYMTAFNMDIIVNRFSCLSGPMQWGKCAQGWVAWFAIASLLNKKLDLIGWNGKQVRDILFADDICNLVHRQINTNKRGVYNIGGGIKNSASLVEVLDDIYRLTNKKVKYDIIEDPRKADHVVYVTDHSKATKDFGWEPIIDIDSGLFQIICWANHNIDKLKEIYE